MKENRYIVYKHIFPNGKSYIGITKQDPLKRWQKGEGYKTQPKIYNAIKKYGWENVTHIIIAKNLYEDEAKKLEESLISADDTIVNGYNQSFGGYANVSTQTNDEYLQIYNAFLGDGSFDNFLEKTENNKELLKNMVKFSLKQGKIDNGRTLKANIAADIIQFSFLCDTYLAFRYLFINNGDEMSIKIVNEQAKKFDEDMWNQTFSNHKKWWFNPHKRALKLFYEKVTKNNLFKSEVK